MVQPGRTVKKGDLLIELDRSAATEQSRDQHIRLKKAQAELVAAEASFPAARRAAADAVAVAEKALRVAQRQLEAWRATEHPAREHEMRNRLMLAGERAAMLDEHLHRLQAARTEQEAKAPTREIQEAQLALFQAKADLEQMESRLRLLKAVEWPQRIDELELAIARRELELLRARNELEQIARHGEAAIDIAKLVLETEKDRLECLMREISACSIHAPRDGTVLSPDEALPGASCETRVRPGDVARPAQVLLRITDLTQLKLEARLSLPLAQRIAPGQTAAVRCDASPRRTFRAHITRIRLVTDSEGPEEAVVTLRLDDPVKGFKTGMTATFEIDLSDGEPGRSQTR